MKIKFRGQHNAEEVVESLAAILNMFEEQYSVIEFNDIKISLTLVNDVGEEVELIDASTSEVFEMLEVHKSLDDAHEEFDAMGEEEVEYIDVEMDVDEPTEYQEYQGRRGTLH